MLKIKVITVGKIKESWLEEALAEYEKRLKPFLSVAWIIAKTEAQLEEFFLKEPSPIALDPKGKEMTSEAFASLLFQRLEEGGSRLTFGIGGPDGFSDAVRKKASLCLSLSPMTFTHQLVRLILVEQLYRASEIRRGSKYHKY